MYLTGASLQLRRLGRARPRASREQLARRQRPTARPRSAAAAAHKPLAAPRRQLKMVLHILKCEAASTSLQLERPVWSAERPAWKLAAASSFAVCPAFEV